MGNFPVPDFKYDGLLISSLVPCERRSEFKKWVRFYLHFCEKYQHNPAEVKSLPLFIEKLSSKNQTTEQQAFDVIGYKTLAFVFSCNNSLIFHIFQHFFSTPK